MRMVSNTVYSRLGDRNRGREAERGAEHDEEVEGFEEVSRVREALHRGGEHVRGRSRGGGLELHHHGLHAALGDEVGDLAPEPREDAHVGRRRARGGEGLYVLGGGQELVPLDKLGALFVVGLVIDEAGIGDGGLVQRDKAVGHRRQDGRKLGVGFDLKDGPRRGAAHELHDRLEVRAREDPKEAGRDHVGQCESRGDRGGHPRHGGSVRHGDVYGRALAVGVVGAAGCVAKAPRACAQHHREEGGCDDEHALATAGCTEGKCEPGDGEHVDYDVENTVETVEVENADVVARATLAQRLDHTDDVARASLAQRRSTGR